MIRPLAWLVGAVLSLVVLPGAMPQEDPEKQDDLKERAQRFKKDVTETRGLEFKKDVKVGVYSRDDLLAFLKKEMEREAPKEKVDQWAAVYRHFGLIPEDLDLYQAFLDLYGSSIAGFYHPRSKELRLVRPGEGDKESQQMEKMFKQMFGVGLEDITLVHELHHAAQDQNFELSSLPLDDETNDDRIMAIKGVIEGDASAVGLKWGLKEKFDDVIGMMNDGYKRGQLGGAAAKLPAYLRFTLTFPYGYGTEFVLAVLKNGDDDWKAIDKAFTRFPLSTEQVLHPEKFYGAEPDWPMEVEIKDVDSFFAGQTRIGTNVFGEFCTRILLKEFEAGKTRELNQATQGWDGDRYYAYRNAKGKVSSVWMSTWDSDDDATEFAERYLVALEKKHANATKAGAGDRWTLTHAGGKVLLERRGQDVLVVDAVDAAVTDKADAIFKATAKREVSAVERLKLTHHCPQHPEERSHKADRCTQCEGEMKPIPEGEKKDKEY